ncbi:MAG: roadblock/LC7 domain-containing protein [Promethearchaeati archaeon SRVP18_Atabeyarchaeia-1]
MSNSSNSLFDKEMEKSIGKLLEKISNDIDLEAIALITREGRRVAFFARKDVDPDLLAALSAAMLSMGEMSAERMEQAPLRQVIVRGAGGYTILTSAGPRLLLIGAGSEEENLGLVIRILKEYANKIEEVLEK